MHVHVKSKNRVLKNIRDLQVNWQHRIFIFLQHRIWLLIKQQK